MKMVKVGVGVMVMGVMGVALGAFHPDRNWPVLKTYDRDHLYRIGLPVGGIGTGTITLSGRGEWRNCYEMMNEPAINVPDYGNRINKGLVFLVHGEGAGKRFTRMLAGPLQHCEYMQGNGQPAPFHGLPRFENATFKAAYPFGQVQLSDSDLPIKATVKAFNPFVPGDVDASSLPIAVISYELKNDSNEPLEVSVCGSMHNIIGGDVRNMPNDYGFGPEPNGAKNNVNDIKETELLKGIAFRTLGVETNSISWGTMALSVDASERDVTYRTSTRYEGWNDYNTLLDFWDDFDDDGRFTQPKDWPQPDPRAAVAVCKTIPAGGTAEFTFFMTWSFPNRMAWSTRVEGNYYTRLYPEAWSAAEKIVPQLPELESRTAKFVNAYLSSTMPDCMKEAALFNLAVLRSQTVFRLPDGHLMGWEGVFDKVGSCLGSCTHVWNFEQALPFLFPELAMSMRDVEFNYATRDDGHMAFRVKLPLSEGTTWVRHNGDTCAADGQMGCIIKAYREWRFSGDDTWLRLNWKRIKAAISYAWTGKEKWDADADGQMEGKQDNTWDIPYYGPNPEVGFWYLGALKAGVEMAKFMGEAEFAEKLQKMLENGRRVMDEKLFNGEYYEHIVYDANTLKPLPKGADHPYYQMGTACLCTQLAGQFVADGCGLGELSDRGKQRKALEAMMKYNFSPRWKGHFSNARSFVMEDEGGLAATAWPKGREKVPVPCWAEAWTGYEYAAASEMIRAGMFDEAIKVVSTARSRHEGAKRNPFDEPECGHFYARCLSSWGLVVAWSDFRWDGRTGEMSFTKRPGKYFWSVNNAWGTCEVDAEGKAHVNIIEGKLERKTKSDLEKEFIAPAVVGQVHASTVLPILNGGFLAAWFEGTKEGHADVAIWGATRENGKWSEKRRLAKINEKSPHWNPVLRRADDGRISLYFKVGRNTEWRTYVIDSRDEGATWSEPRELVFGDVQGGRGPVRNKCLRLKSGRWLAPASTEFGPCWRAFIDRSDDDGRTWTASPIEMPDPTGKAGLIQPTLWVAADGRVRAYMRSNTGHVWESESSDDGVTWSTARETSLPNNNSGIDLVKAANGNIYLVTNTASGDWVSRSELEIWRSTDDGASWKPWRVLEKNASGEFSYPCIIESTPGKLAVTYTWKRKCIAFVELLSD